MGGAWCSTASQLHLSFRFPPGLYSAEEGKNAAEERRNAAEGRKYTAEGREYTAEGCKAMLWWELLMSTGVVLVFPCRRW